MNLHALLLEREAAGRPVTVGVIDHHTLQVERPEEVANQIRAALKHIPAERLMVSSDCGMGREGMSRRHAFYKAVRSCSAPISCARSSARRRRKCSPPTNAIRWWCRRSNVEAPPRTLFTLPWRGRVASEASGVG